ncbi:hypothetical protein LRR18_03900 [Mangrovimonas sp. AS39]|uniref:hypothetical protein n=1 Tax=Mangrovimonas futianensis TaxID=2895523 RepID=UPI001E39E865|nr:hypothetical protein [Mangrovimonas futianensis]MCF1190718.1 hypothetical protein [Mangrovimonas futianensis]MCF1194415.1 hypothetical protein [Mangrovimonas futianensis]
MDKEIILKPYSNEKHILFIDKKSEVGFWNYQMFGLFSFLLNKKRDCLIITENRIILIIENELVTEIEHDGVLNIKFNPLNDSISFNHPIKNAQALSLRSLRLTYDEIQKIKNVLH